MNDLACTTLASPLGLLHLAACDEGLVHMLFDVQVDDATRELGPSLSARTHPVLAQAVQELVAYFAGTLTAFTVALAPRGTAFQVAVWRALGAIPLGETRSYRDIAGALDKRGAERAVGNANGKNRIGIIVPCHRVIGASGALTGYAAGLDKKRWLLAHEARLAGRTNAARGATLL